MVMNHLSLHDSKGHLIYKSFSFIYVSPLSPKNIFFLLCALNKNDEQ